MRRKTKFTSCVAGLLACAGLTLSACGGDEPQTASVAEPTATDRPLPGTTGEATVAEAPKKDDGKQQDKPKDDGKQPDKPKDDGDKAAKPPPSPAPDEPQLDPTETDPGAAQQANAATIVVAVYENAQPHAPRFSWGPAGNDQKYPIDVTYNSIHRDKPGPVKIKFINRTGNPHSFHIAGPSSGGEVGRTDVIRNGKASVSLNAGRGDYVFFCSVTGHQTEGMEGHLLVG